MAPKIYISPSDQVSNTYAVGNTNEAVQCREIGLLTVEALKRCGLSALTNTKDGMGARVTESNKWGADLHVCIHTNACNTKVQGTRLMSFDLKGFGYKACKAILEALAPITPGTSDNITERPGLYEVKNTTAPCAYIEVAFHDNKEEAQWIIDHKEDIAEAICKGLCNFYGVNYVPKEETKETTIYRVQIGAFSVKENAEKQLAKAKAAGFTDAYITTK